jgi:hypothetical protein
MIVVLNVIDVLSVIDVIVIDVLSLIDVLNVIDVLSMINMVAQKLSSASGRHSMSIHMAIYNLQFHFHWKGFNQSNL